MNPGLLREGRCRVSSGGIPSGSKAMQDRGSPVEFGEVVRTEEQKACRSGEQARCCESDFGRCGGLGANEGLDDEQIRQVEKECHHMIEGPMEIVCVPAAAAEQQPES